MQPRRRSARLLLTTSLVVSALVLSLVSVAQASDKSKKRQVDKKISSLKHDLEDSSSQLANAIKSLRRAEAQLKAAQAKVAKVRGQLAAAQARDAMLGEKLAVAIAEVQRSEQEIAATEAKIKKTQRIIGQIARQSYQQGNYAEIAVVLNADTPDQFANRLVLVQDAVRSQGAALSVLSDDKADLAAQRATLDAKREQIAGLKKAQEKLVADIKDLEQRAVEAQQQVESLVGQRESAVRAVERERAAQRARLAKAQAESQALARRIAAAAAAAARRARLSSRTPRGGSLFWPANGRISTYAGYRTNPVTGSPSCHSGIDIAPGYGAPIYAAASGVVVATQYTSWDGNTTIIAHGGGMTTWYAHQDSFGVHVGEHVRRGEVIGRVGSSGFATGPHLHFNVVLGETAMDPMGWFGGSRRSVASLCPNGPSPVL